MSVTASFTGLQSKCCYGIKFTDTSTTTDGDAIYNGVGRITYQVFDEESNSWKNILTSPRGATLETTCCALSPRTTPYSVRSNLVISQIINCVENIIYNVFSAAQDITVLEYKPYLEVSTNIKCCNVLQKNNANVNLGFALKVNVLQYNNPTLNQLVKTVTGVAGLVLTMSDTVGIEVGQKVYGTGMNQDGVFTVLSLTSTTVNISGGTPSPGTFTFGNSSLVYTLLNKNNVVLETKQIGFGRILAANSTPSQYVNISYQVTDPTLFNEKTNYRLKVKVENECHAEEKEYVINICENYKVEYFDCTSVKITNYLTGFGNRTFKISKLNSNLSAFEVIVPSTVLPNAPVLSGELALTIPITADGVYLISFADDTVNNSIADFSTNTNVGFTKSYIFIFDCNIKKCILQKSIQLGCLNFDCGFMSLNNVDQRKTLFEYLKVFNAKDIIYGSWTKYKNQISFYETSTINTAVIAALADTQLAINSLLKICGCSDTSKLDAINKNCGCEEEA